MSKPIVLLQAQGTSVYGTVSSAATILTARVSRVYLNINTPGTIYVTLDGSTPSATNGFQVNATTPLIFDSRFVPTGPVNIFSATPTAYAILWA